MATSTNTQPDKKAGAASKAKTESLGRLKSFGLKEPWQVALLLPSSWDDLTRVVDRYDAVIENGTSCVFVGKLAGPPETKFEAGKPPRLTGYLLDPAGRKVGFSVFGDSREFKDQLNDDRNKVYLFGRVETYNERYWIKGPEIVQEKWIGRFRPRYPGKAGVIKPETVRDRVIRELRKAIPIAAEYLASELKCFGDPKALAALAGLPGWPLETIITQSHVPKTPQFGQSAQRAMEHLASLGIMKGARNQHGAKQITPPRVGNWKARAARIPFKLTDEQDNAIRDALADITSDQIMHRMLVGDVGTGKTAVYGTVAAAVVDGGGTVAVLLPNEGLAAQVAREFGSWWPDLHIQIVTGSSKETKISAPLVVGTTALLFRDIGHPTLALVDEQQKFARNQREQLVGAGTHLLEVSATCIPRSAALVRYGIVKVSKLTKSHTKKNIHTRIWLPEHGQELAKNIRQTIVNGDQVLYVYPLRETDAEEMPVEDEMVDTDLDGEVIKDSSEPAKKKLELKSATDMFEKWHKIYPGKVRLIHGQMPDDEKTAALRDMREGRAMVLIATTVVEVGINLPKLRRVVVCHPERHGLTTLHQIRGRVARLGGEGWCDLYLPNPVKENTMARLKVLEQTQDGFKVAEHDMCLRGVGDISRNSSKQSGADETFLFGRPVSIEALDAVMTVLSAQKME